MTKIFLDTAWGFYLQIGFVLPWLMGEPQISQLSFSFITAFRIDWYQRNAQIKL